MDPFIAGLMLLWPSLMGGRYVPDRHDGRFWLFCFCPTRVVFALPWSSVVGGVSIVGVWTSGCGSHSPCSLRNFSARSGSGGKGVFMNDITVIGGVPASVSGLPVVLRVFRVLRGRPVPAFDAGVCIFECVGSPLSVMFPLLAVIPLTVLGILLAVVRVYRGTFACLLETGGCLFDVASVCPGFSVLLL